MTSVSIHTSNVMLPVKDAFVMIPQAETEILTFYICFEFVVKHLFWIWL